MYVSSIREGGHSCRESRSTDNLDVELYVR